MEVLLAQLYEILVLLVEGSHWLDGGYLLDYFGLFLGREQVWDLSVVKYVANLLDHRLLKDLRVREQEDGLSLFKACNLHDFLHLLDPVLGVDLVVLSHVGNVGAQHGERLTPTTSDSDQQSMAECGGQYPDYLDNMFDGDHEENQIHPVTRIQVVELLQVGLTLLLH